MSADSVLEGALTMLLEKAQRQGIDPPVRPANLDLAFVGGGQPLTAATADPVSHEIPFPCRLVWAHMYALDGRGRPISVSATIDVQITQFSTLGASAPLYGSASIPALSAASSADLSLSGWQLNLITGDIIIATLATFTGSALKVGLALQFRPTDVPIGVSGYTDAGGGSYVDANGEVYVFRS